MRTINFPPILKPISLLILTLFFGQSLSAKSLAELDIIANDDTVFVDMNTSITFDPTLNDDGDNLFINSYESLDYIEITANGNELSITPQQDYSGLEILQYEVCDTNTGECATASIHIYVPAVFPSSITIQLYPGDAYDLFLLETNEPFFETWELILPPSQGIVDETDDLIQYISNAEATGTDYFEIRIDSGIFGFVLIGEVSVYFIDENFVQANDDHYSTNNNSFIFNPLENDTYADSAVLTWLEAPSYGTLESTTNGYIYTHNQSENFTEMLPYEICNNNGYCDSAVVTINYAPIQPYYVDFLYQVYANTVSEVLFEHITWGIPPNSPPIITIQPENGMAEIFEIDNQYALRYTPNPDYLGDDYFQLNIDGTYLGLPEILANFYVEVIDENAITAHDDYYYLDLGETLYINPAENDVGLIDAINFLEEPPFGTMEFDVNYGLWKYTSPDSLPNGEQFIIEYEACNSVTCDTAYVNFTVNPTTANPDQYYLEYDLIAGDTTLLDGQDIWSVLLVSDVQQGQYSTYFAENNLHYIVTEANYTGGDTILTRVNADYLGLGEIDLFLFLNIFNPETFLTAIDDVVTTGIDTPISFDVFANDYGNDLYISDFTPSINGQLETSTNGIFTYTPNSGFEGVDEFIYTVCNQYDYCREARVEVYVVNPTDAFPTEVFDFEFTTFAETPFMFILDGIGIESGTLVELSTPPSNGTYNFQYEATPFYYESLGDTLAVPGVSTYTPNPGFVGEDFFSIDLFLPAFGFNLTLNFYVTVIPEQGAATMYRINPMTNESSVLLNGATANPDTATDVENPSKPSLNFFPNPASDILTVRGLQISKNSFLEIYNLNGQLIKNQRVTNDTELVNIENLSAGAYLLRYAGEAQIFVKK